MTKRTSSAASGLSSIDRRSLVCGLGTAAAAGVPVLAGTTSNSDAKLLPHDPVFQAIAALEQLKIHAEEQEAAYEIAEAAVFRARNENVAHSRPHARCSSRSSKRSG